MAEAPEDDTSPQHAEGGHIPILRELVQLPVSPVWYLLGLQLGVSADDLDVIEKDYPRDTDMRKVKMFSKWLRIDTNPTFEKLIKALAAVGRKNLAESVCARQGISKSILDAMDAVELRQSSDEAKSDVVAAARAKIVELQDEYESLVTVTQEAVQAKSPTLTEFRNKITLRPPESIKSELQLSLKEILPCICNAKSIEEIFAYLNLYDVWNYLNYGLLQHLVEVYGDDKLHQKMAKYTTLVDSFRRETSLEVFWKARPASKNCPEIPSSLRDSLKQVVFKHGNLDGTASLDDIERHRQHLARHVSLPDLTIILKDIKDGCIAIVWLVPPSVAAKLADEVQRGNVDFLEQHDILELEIEDSTVYHSKKISFSDLEFGDQLGEGAYGVVYQGHWKSRDLDVAIKRVSGRVNKVESEILSQLRHPHIIQFHGVAVVVNDRPGPPEHYIVTELAEGGSLYDLLYKKKYKPSQEESLQWATQIAEGMEYLHQKKMMHRDLKSSNVLLTGDGNIKICDFGVATNFDHTTKQTQTGTYRWMAPEVMEGEPVSLSADVFSYGMLLYEIFTCKLPFADAKSDLVVIGKIMRREIPPIPVSVKFYLAKLLKQCWDANPKARPSFHDILEILTKGPGVIKTGTMETVASSPDQGLTVTEARAMEAATPSLDQGSGLQVSRLEHGVDQTSLPNVSDYHEQDPLADATYIRANFTYIPRTPKELGIKSGDVFHIHDEAPSERFRASFWVSRLSSDGTDEQIGAIPNSMRAQEYLEAQGECLDIPLYEEVEAYTGRRPVLIFGALADQVTASLLEGFPTLFYPCPSDTVEGTARIIEARLKREVSEGRIIDFRRSEVGFEVIRIEAINSKQTKGKHCLLIGTIQALQSLKSQAPPISILIKPMTEESITTFSPEEISPEHAREVCEEVTALEEHVVYAGLGRDVASLFLVYMEVMMGQIEAIVKKEKRKQAWVPVTKET